MKKVIHVSFKICLLFARFSTILNFKCFPGCKSCFHGGETQDIILSNQYTCKKLCDFSCWFFLWIESSNQSKVTLLVLFWWFTTEFKLSLWKILWDNSWENGLQKLNVCEDVWKIFELFNFTTYLSNFCVWKGNLNF